MTVLQELLNLERQALARWIQGDPMGYAELAGEGMTYVDPYLPTRLDGLESFQARMTSLVGQIHADGFEILDPVVEVSGEMAVMSFRLLTWVGERHTRWNTTEVFRRFGSTWCLVHSHWSRPVV